MNSFFRIFGFLFFLVFSAHAQATYNASLLWTYNTSSPTNSDMNTECISTVGPIVGFSSTGAVLTGGDGTGVGNTAACVDSSGTHRATITLYAWCGSTFNGYTLTCSGTPPVSCPSGFTADSTGTQCIQTSTGISMSPSDAVCTSHENTTVSSGYYDVGNSPVSSIPAACSVPSGASSGCMAIYSGSLTSQALVAGVEHYFFHGQLSTVGGSGSSCSSSTAATALPSVPADMPDGSLVLIDEAQSCFPPRSSASSPPDYISWLNTHRHKGFDIWLTTQHPKLIDFSVRALIGKHVHFRRLFGGKRAITYEWDSCCDSLNSMSTAVKSYYSYPKKAFQWYKSAEIHTKQSFKLPAFIIVPIIAIAMSFYTIPRAYSLYKNGIHGHHETKVSSSDSSFPNSSKFSPASDPAPSKISPNSKPADVIRNGIDWSRVAGCMQMGGKVACFDDGGARVPMPDFEAVNALKNGWPGRSFAVDAPAPSEPVSAPAAVVDPLHHYEAD